MINKDIKVMRWMVSGTSIVTEEAVELKLESQRKMIHLSVAFNVGADIAQHLVDLHNQSLTNF